MLTPPVKLSAAVVRLDCTVSIRKWKTNFA